MNITSLSIQTFIPSKLEDKLVCHRIVETACLSQSNFSTIGKSLSEENYSYGTIGFMTKGDMNRNDDFQILIPFSTFSQRINRNSVDKEHLITNTSIIRYSNIRFKSIINLNNVAITNNSRDVTFLKIPKTGKAITKADEP